MNLEAIKRIEHNIGVNKTVRNLHRDDLKDAVDGFQRGRILNTISDINLEIKKLEIQLERVKNSE